MEPREIMSATKEQIYLIGAAFMFHPDTLARGKELGLSGMRFYAIGRGGVLGDVEPDVVGARSPTSLPPSSRSGGPRPAR